ncbi:ribose ABC transporter permease [Alkaliphilus crotonatoxidans]
MNEKLQQLMKTMRSVILLIIFAAIIAIINPRFLTVSNLLNVLRQTSINAIIAAGMTFVILTGGIDLSVGSILGFIGALAAWLIAAGVNWALVLIISLVVGTLLGLANGYIITRGKVQPFIATLATMTLLRGATLVFTDGKPISIGHGPGAAKFADLGSGYLLGIPLPIYMTLAVFALGYYILKQTPFGRYTYALGGNEEATALSGINTRRIKAYVYGISGLLSALAGIIVTARLSSAQPQAGSGYELDAIAAVVLGGTSLSGGVGGILGTVIGALIIGILNNGLNLMDVSSYYQQLVKGLVILIAVLLDRKSK